MNFETPIDKWTGFYSLLTIWIWVKIWVKLSISFTFEVVIAGLWISYN